MDQTPIMIEMPGWEPCREVRRQSPSLRAVLILQAEERDDLEDMVSQLDAWTRHYNGAVIQRSYFRPRRPRTR